MVEFFDGVGLRVKGCGEPVGAGHTRAVRPVLRRTLNQSPGFSQPEMLSPEAALTRLVESEIIPRLFLAHASHPSTPSSTPLSPGLDAFLDLLLSRERLAVEDLVEGWLGSGLAVEEVCLNLLAPAARRLGVMWEEDHCSFMDVTFGLARLNALLREISRRRTGSATVSVGSILLMPFPGEQHTFGLAMVEEFFRHAGWQTATDPASSVESVLSRVAASDYDVIGISVSSTDVPGSLAELVDRIRRASRSRNVEILLGGNLLVRNPQFAMGIPHTHVILEPVQAVEAAGMLLRGNPAMAHQ